MMGGVSSKNIETDQVEKSRDLWGFPVVIDETCVGGKAVYMLSEPQGLRLKGMMHRYRYTIRKKSMVAR
jgi:hypothetical protein